MERSDGLDIDIATAAAELGDEEPEREANAMLVDGQMEDNQKEDDDVTEVGGLINQ